MSCIRCIMNCRGALLESILYIITNASLPKVVKCLISQYRIHSSSVQYSKAQLSNIYCLLIRAISDNHSSYARKCHGAPFRIYRFSEVIIYVFTLLPCSDPSLRASHLSHVHTNLFTAKRTSSKPTSLYRTIYTFSYYGPPITMRRGCIAFTKCLFHPVKEASSVITS